MCGIFGYVGKKDPIKICIGGLKQLEYRGYDSAGIAGLYEGQIKSCKEAGKIASLEKKILSEGLKLDFAIGHTRWATHGKPTDQNAHPHFDEKSSLALVHNGIIENFSQLRDQLKSKNVRFTSETDTEVIAQLIGQFYRGDLLDAVQKTLPLLQGSFAIAIIHSNHPGQIVAAARESPLSIGYDDQHTESIVSSDPNAFLPSTSNVMFLRGDEIAQVEAGKISIFNSTLKPIEKKIEKLESNYQAPSKEGFEHFLIKEIYEQSSTIQKALLGRLNDESACIEFENFHFSDEYLKSIRNIWLLGCGTSSHAGWIGTMFFEDLSRVNASVEIASEARYRNPLLASDTLVIAISQSGETADTIAAMREAKRRGCSILGICNVVNSTLSREADSTIFLKAGPEMSVCSTKAFSSQVAVLALFALHIARLKGLSDGEMRKYFAHFRKISGSIQQVLEKSSLLQTIAKKYAKYNDFFFMGRRYMVPTCLEAALKLKEISYVNANGYPAGELKHGPIALICPNFPVVAFCSNDQTLDKIVSNLMEVKARGAPILAFAPEGLHSIIEIADDIFWLPESIDPFAPFASIVAGQLFAYYIAKDRGCDIDQPRNLAKSVTVE
ncbi:MAG: glmS [Parachlamydiales bacterium]|nr:glmS [Parachlamydiales bacterium]